MSCPLTVERNTGLGDGLTLKRADLCPTCAAAFRLVEDARLVTRQQIHQYLALRPEQVQSLIDTQQITSLRIKGEERFDRRDLDLLIEQYKNTARRRAALRV